MAVELYCQEYVGCYIGLTESNTSPLDFAHE